MVCGLQDSQEQDTTEVLGLYFEALDEELVALQTSMGAHKPFFALKVEELREETQAGRGQTGVGERDHTVRRFHFLSALSLRVADICMDANRRAQIRLPSRAYSVEGPVRPYTRQTSPTASVFKTGESSNSISRSALPFFHLHIFPGDKYRNSPKA
jgi:hypothetical protein